MKKSAILDIFNGFRGHRDTMNIPKDEKRNLSIVCDNELKEKLSPELLCLYQKFIDILESNWSDALDFYFVEGFKLGLLIGIECAEN